MHRLALSLILVLVAGTPVWADANEPHPHYHHVIDLADLELDAAALRDMQWTGAMRRGAHVPRVRVEGVGQAFLGYEWGVRREGAGLADGRIAVRVPARRDVHGEVFVPRRDGGEARATFHIAAQDLEAQPHTDYHRTVVQHYDRLLEHNLAGQSWFQARRQLAQRMLTVDDDADAPQADRAARRRDFDRQRAFDATFDLFTGVRAASENLQLDDVLEVDAGAARADADVALDTIEGITVEPVDWDELIDDPDPARDALARHVPADQFAVFFPSVSAVARAAAEAGELGSRVIQWADRTEDFDTLRRYERQLGVSLERFAPLAADAAVASIALTASDPYLIAGSDVAVLIETADAPRLAAALRGLQDRAAADAGVERVTRSLAADAGGVEASIVVTDAREVSSYLAVLDDTTVVLSNSPVQLERVVRAGAGSDARLADLDEYIYFRGRYRLDEPETLWLLVPDDAIRKWGSAQWRVGASRRARMLAAMLHTRAAHMAVVLADDTAPGELDVSVAVPDAGALRMTDAGVVSDVYGRPAFLTPISELAITHVTDAEAAAYERWRDRYQGRWRYEFCPIALRMRFHDDRLAGDITVLPLIEGSDYRQWMAIAGDSQIDQPAPLHAPTLAHFAMALDLESEPLVDARNMARMMLANVENPLGWIGRMFGVYVEDAAFWEELAASDDGERFLTERGFAVPVALYVQVRQPLALAGFLTGARALVQSTAPGMVRWVNREHAGRDYVAIVSEAMAADAMGVPDQMQLLYASRDGYLLLTLNELLMQRFLERSGDAAQEGGDAQDDDDAAERRWLGRHVNLHLDGRTLRLAQRLASELGEQHPGTPAWRALPVLNDLRQHWPEHDPVEVYHRFAGSTLAEPFGGRYEWHDGDGTMRSTAVGHPGDPHAPATLPTAFERVEFASFGLEFTPEHDALRGRVEIERSTDGSTTNP